MVRELAIFLFLFSFHCVFLLFSLLPLKEKTTFIVSFGDNSKYVLDEIQRQSIQTDVAVLCQKNKLNLFKNYTGIDLVPFSTFNVIHWIKFVYHLATSRYVMVDNYFGFLAAVHWRKGVQCIQLWHASGALKKFGLEDESVKYRSPKAKQRFLNVYSKFHKVAVGSDAMAAIFIQSFNLNEEQILRTGVPRTDFFFNDKAVQKAKKKLIFQHPILENKKIILYVPTYRDRETNRFALQLDIAQMAKKLGHDFILLLRLHPAIQNPVSFLKQYPDFLVDVSASQYDINDLLVTADYLITDYSSVIVEFSLLQKPMLFFTYDLKEYKRSRGVLEEFEKNLPGPIVEDTNSIIDLLQEDHFNFEAVKRYAEVWNKYSRGYSSCQLVQYMFPKQTLIEKGKRTFQ